MKKISILISVFVLSIITSIVGVYAADAIRSYYKLDFLTDTLVDLETGVLVDADDYYTSEFVSVLNNELYLNSTAWHFIFWYDTNNVYKGFTPNDRLINMSELVLIPDVVSMMYSIFPYPPDDPLFSSLNLYSANELENDGVVKFRVAFSSDVAAWFDTNNNYVVSLYSIILYNSILNVDEMFFAKYYQTDYNIVFPREQDTRRYITRRYELSPSRVVGGEPIVFNANYVLSEEVEIKNYNVRRKFNPNLFKWTIKNPEDWLSTYNDFHVLIWFDENRDYLGFSTSVLVSGVSSELLPFYLGSYDLRNSQNLNLVPGAVFNTAKYFRIMNLISAPRSTTSGVTLDARFENSNLLDTNDRVGLLYKPIEDDLLPPLSFLYATVSTVFDKPFESAIDRYEFFYTSSIEPNPKNIDYILFNILDNFNLNNPDAKFIIAIVVVLVLSGAVLFLNGNFGVFIFVASFGTLAFVIIGWMPSWIALTAIILASILLVFKVIYTNNGGGD